MQYATMLLNKVIEANDVGALARFNITEADMPTASEKQAYKFIANYAEANRGQAPSYATVVAEVEGFDYLPEISDGYEYLTKQIKSATAKREFYEMFKPGENNSPSLIDRKINDLDGQNFLEWLQSNIESIKINTNTSSKIGTDLKRDGSSFLDEYLKRKEGKSFKIWRSKFGTINDQIGGYMSGNMYTWYGRSGRGKSVFTMEEIIEAAFQGANVLVWSMEMSRFEWMARAYSSISARVSGTTEVIDGVDYEIGFENRLLLTGGLSDGYEQGLRAFIDKLNEILDGNIILRAADDVDFVRRDVRQLEADIIQTKADVVLVDPIYLMDYEANTSKVAGGDVANTSKKIRRIAGYTNATIHIITQAEEVRDDTDEEGNRELRAPKRAEIKKTKVALEDATNTFGIDSLDGRGLIEIGKGRNGGEGTQVEVLYLPNYGIVREMPTGEVAASQFDF
ncbi:DnaB-like helicase C-terminal domain-containing protein [Heyndrickxia sporothermodurans]|uniref:DnaB-like helicase C-terminal domain-containing protein n=1 Tax=Heyndrickxia sporothermodurans TaxID=46224 RepID=UPI002E1CA118|nr:DnaB-like helicase C-terminal domain-containing protein [Heyndrickxia sporothermodurans]MED3649995.1 DnaB-like helicase C-terminal domain-containing protein [Heyndrickxia sporothermodurans]MED3697981.1 DnaB-like helicase C-terminal domain-containing protein [Heyndrickxia sporothermodurans]